MVRCTRFGEVDASTSYDIITKPNRFVSLKAHAHATESTGVTHIPHNTKKGQPFHTTHLSAAVACCCASRCTSSRPSSCEDSAWPTPSKRTACAPPNRPCMALACSVITYSW
jgi:hypothetical protein